MLQGNMLQTDRHHTRIPSDSGEGGVGEMINFAQGLLRRQYVVIIFTSVLAIALCVVYLRITPPTYTGQAQVLLGNPNKSQFVQQQSLVAEPTFDLNQIETQLQIVKSSSIAVAVIKQLKLADDPDFNGSPPGIGTIWRKIRARFSPPPSEMADQYPPEDLIGAFEDRLLVSRVGYSNVIEISFNSSRAARAAEIANAVANAYIADLLNAKFEANRNATAWLQGRLRDLGDQALTAERAVSAFRTQNNMVSSGAKPINEQQITDLNSRQVAARAQTSDALARLNNYEAILRANSKNSPSIGTLDASGSDALVSPIINNLRQQYLDLARRESEWSSRFGHNHLAVINLRTRMNDIRTSILDEVRRLAETSRNDYEVAKQRQQEIEKQLNEAVALSRTNNSAEITLRELESQAKGYRSLYETFLQRYMGAAQQESFPIVEARVISPALTPDSKSKPKTNMILALGAFGGIALGIALGLIRDMLDRVFRTAAQIETSLQLACLSLVPVLPTPKEPKVPPAGIQQSDEDIRQRTLSTRSSIHRAVIDMPLSRFAEAIRSIKLAIDLNPTKASNKVIGITSALPNEGKTTVAASVAQLIGHSGKSVIIVDCDLRNPSLSANLAPNAAAGIVEVIYGKRPLEQTIWRDPKTNLAFLPAVRRGALLHTSEILSAEATRTLLDQLRATYDYVIVDLPPLSPVVDVRATTSWIDSYILIVEWGRTKIDVVEHALHTAPNIYENLIGAVLNKTDIKVMGHYDSYLSDYYSDSHYTRYGFTDPV